MLSTLLFKSGLNVFAQNDSLSRNEVRLFIAPLNLLDMYSGSSTRAGVEFGIKNNVTVYTEIGTFLPRSVINRYWLRKNGGLIAKSELKYYTNKNKSTTGKFFSCEIFYKVQSYETTDSIDLNPGYVKDYSVSKKVGCLTVKCGKITVNKNRFVSEYSFGLGVRFKLSESTLTATENEHIALVGDSESNVYNNKSGKFIYPNVVILGFKIGYQLK